MASVTTADGKKVLVGSKAYDRELAAGTITTSTPTNKGSTTKTTTVKSGTGGLPYDTASLLQRGEELLAKSAQESPTGSYEKAIANLNTQNLYSATYNAAKAQLDKAYGTISTDTLTKPQTPMNVAQPRTTSPYDVSSLQVPKFEMTAAEKEAQASNEELRKLYEGLVGQSAYQTEQENIYGVPQKQQQITDLSSQLQALQNEAAAIPLQLQQGAAERGVTTPVLSRQENSRLRTNAIAALGVSTLLNAAQGNLATAQQMADRAVAQKYDPIKEEIAAKTANLELIMKSPEYSTQDKQRALQLQANLDAQSRAIAQAERQDQQISQIAIQAASMGVDTQTLQRIQNAPNAIAATQIAQQAGIFAPEANYQFIGGTGTQPSGYFNPATGEFVSYGGGVGGGGGLGGSTQTFQQFLQQRQNEMGMSINPSNPLYAQLQQEYSQGTGGVEDQFVQMLLSTKGGKNLTDTTIQKLDKGLTVLGQLGVLQENIADENTGPLVGAFRGANPWDNNAQTIKAQLNAIVPNLARGVYGEVGVLTDNDIRTYSQTIPNIRSTEEVRNAVMYITLDMIGKSIKNTLSVNAAAGRDVSGFVDLYSELENTKNGIIQSVGYKDTSIPGSDVYDSIIGDWSTTGTYQSDFDNGLSWLDMFFQTQ